MKKHTFGEAMAAMESGKYGRLPHWQPGVYMFIRYPQPGDMFNRPFFCMRTPGAVFPCEPTQTGIFSKEWEICEPTD